MPESGASAMPAVGKFRSDSMDADFLRIRFEKGLAKYGKTYIIVTDYGSGFMQHEAE
jgi:hypothetical protein